MSAADQWTLGRRQELRLADRRRMLLCDAPPKTPVHCPVHPDENASAFTIQNRHSVSGVYCSACSKTYWPDDPRHDEYDPDDSSGRPGKSPHRRADVARELGILPEGGPAREGLAGCRVQLVSGRAAPAKLQPGITLVRSDKGTGKTEAMKRLAARVGRSYCRSPAHPHPRQLQAAGSHLLPRPRQTGRPVAAPATRPP